MDATNPLSWVYFPTAVILGALHALEPGHSKTLTASYLIGIKGTKKDAMLLGLSVAITHSTVVIGIAAAALWVGSESFTAEVTHGLQLISGITVILLGLWLIFKRLRSNKTALRDAHHDDDHEHCEGHDHSLPAYAERGEHPTPLQIIAFGAAGGMIPCPASITVMLLAISVGKLGYGLLALIGFSLGLAVTLVTIGMLVVSGIRQFQQSHRFEWISKNAPVLSAVAVLLSGVIALLTLH